ncbi:MAG: excinuclease ATPase subunit [Clostridiales Family XIII bacterium]|jgi:transcription initiation factor IIE alpha subunit|nr:excinuclease ATPase subunit [Clostridiales Family XIII bacterium]
MTWGTLYFYYQCPACGEKYKYDYSREQEFGGAFGECPSCKTPGAYIKDGPRGADDLDYPEAD